MGICTSPSVIKEPKVRPHGLHMRLQVKLMRPGPWGNGPVQQKAPSDFSYATGPKATQHLALKGKIRAGTGDVSQSRMVFNLIVTIYN